MTDPSLVPLLSQLPTEGAWTALDLARALRSSLDVAAIAQAARFDGSRYVRVPLYRDERLEVRLLCWLPGQASAQHDHGASACAFRVLAGVATETRLDGAVARLRPGDVAVAEADGAHQVANLGAEALITLHVYAPPLPVDQPSRADGLQVVILGGGFCGTALAVHLLRSNHPDLRVTLVERRERVGPGVAFGTFDPAHLLNVPAGQMSVDPGDPLDFVRWVRERGVECAPNALLPRAVYGGYLQVRLREAVTRSRAKLRLVRGEANDVSPDPAGWRVGIVGHAPLRADHVVFATGHGPARVPDEIKPWVGDPRVVTDVWTPGLVESVGVDERVLVVGTGLTAMDLLVSLRRRGIRGSVVAVSRNGRWPRPHLDGVVWGGPVPNDLGAAPATADGLAAWLREQVEVAARRGVPWQAVIGALKSHVPAIWSRLPQAERIALLHRHRSRWEVLRHRTPVESWRELQRWREEGWLRTLKGTVSEVGMRNGRLVALVGTVARVERLELDRVLVCTGAEEDVRRFGEPLWDHVIEQGLIRPDPLGVVTTGNGGVLGRDASSAGLWALGGLQRPRLFESTAVPELAVQAAQLASAILAPLLAGAVQPDRPLVEAT